MCDKPGWNVAQRIWKSTKEPDEVLIYDTVTLDDMPLFLFLPQSILSDASQRTDVDNFLKSWEIVLMDIHYTNEFCHSDHWITAETA